MDVKDFERHIERLSQEEILTAGIDTLNRLLVKKGICTEEEIQKGFLDWMERRGLKPSESEEEIEEDG